MLRESRSFLIECEHALKVMGEDHVGVGSDALLQAFDASPRGMAQFNKSQEQRQKSGLAAPRKIARLTWSA